MHTEYGNACRTVRNDVINNKHLFLWKNNILIDYCDAVRQAFPRPVYISYKSISEILCSNMSTCAVVGKYKLYTGNSRTLFYTVSPIYGMIVKALLENITF